MSAINSKALFPRIAAVSPQSCAAAANKTSSWVKAALYQHLIAQVQLGALGGGTVTATLEQTKSDGAGDASAGDAKLLATIGASSTDNDHLEADCSPESLDLANGFEWVRLKLANAGGTGALLGGILNGANPRYTA